MAENPFRDRAGHWLLLTIAVWLPTAVLFLLGILRVAEVQRQAELQCRLTGLRFTAERVRMTCPLIPRLNRVWKQIRTTSATAASPTVWRNDLSQALTRAGMPAARFYLLSTEAGATESALSPADDDSQAFRMLLGRFLKRDQPSMRDSPKVFESGILLSPIAQFAKVTREHWLYEIAMPTRTIWLAWGRLRGPFRDHAYLLLIRGEELRHDLLKSLWLEIWQRDLPDIGVSTLGKVPTGAVPETTASQWHWADASAISLGFLRDGLAIRLAVPFTGYGGSWLFFALLAWTTLSFAWLAGSLAAIRGRSPPWFLGLRGRLSYHLALSIVLPLFGLLLLGELELSEQAINLLSDQDRFLSGSLERVEQAYSRNIARTQRKMVQNLERMPPVLTASEAFHWGFEVFERRLGASRVMLVASDGTHLLPIHALQKLPYFIIARLPLAEKYRFFRRVFDNDFIPDLQYRRMLTLRPSHGDRLSVAELKAFLADPAFLTSPSAKDQGMMKAMAAMGRSLCRQANEIAGFQSTQGSEPKVAELGTLDMFASLSGIEAEELIKEIFSALGRIMTFNAGNDIIQNLAWLGRDKAGRAQTFALVHWREEDLSLPVSLRLVHRVRRAPRDTGLYLISTTMEGLDLCSRQWPRGFRQIAAGLPGIGSTCRFSAPLPGAEPHFFLLQRSRTMPHLIIGRSVSTGKLLEKLGHLRVRLFLSIILCLCILAWFVRFLHRYLVLPADDIGLAVAVLSSPGHPLPPIRDPVGEFLQLTRLFTRTVENLRELELARAVQENLLPSGPLSQGPWHLHGESRMMEQVGGDYFDFIRSPHTPDRLLVALGDVSGHGLSAAIVVAMAQGALRTMVQQGAEDPKILLETFNRLLFRHLHRTRTMSMQVFQFDLRTGVWLYSNAGQTPPVLVRPDGKSESIEMGAFPAGSREKTKYNLREGLLQTGERLVLYSDGTVEAQGLDGQPLGYHRFAELATRVVLPGWKDACRLFFAEFTHLVKPGGQEDDITFVVIERQA